MNNSDMPARISVILVTWNSSTHLIRCLDCLAVQTIKDFEIAIIDNRFTDGFICRLENRWPELALRVERLNSNLGFAVANNIGVRFARGKWIALLNADAFPEPDWLEQLVRAAEDNPEFTFFTSRQLQANNPELLDGTGDAYHVSGLAWRQNYNHLASEYDIQFEEVFSACAAVALYSRNCQAPILYTDDK